MTRKSLKDGAPGMTRTCDLLVRSQTLYPTELRARNDSHFTIPVRPNSSMRERLHVRGYTRR
jgi:hypothetical protein